MNKPKTPCTQHSCACTQRKLDTMDVFTIAVCLLAMLVVLLDLFYWRPF